MPDPRKERFAELKALCVAVVGSYNSALTVRQVFYQLVTKNLIPNTEKSYKRVVSAVLECRKEGTVGWDEITDQHRNPWQTAMHDNLASFIRGQVRSYRRDPWGSQDTYVMVHLEKAALANIVWEAVGARCVRLSVGRGYDSWTAIYDMAQHAAGSVQKLKDVVVLYCGDHDPSGLDMDRSLIERLEYFAIYPEFRRIALTREQIEQYNLPPQPAKASDSRAEAYTAKHGAQCWELDALPPDVLQATITEAVDQYTDKTALAEVEEQETAERDRLRDFLEKLENGE